jgi:hypothetical protein
VVEVEACGGRPGVHVRKDGRPSTDPLPKHGITAPPAVKVF